MTARKRLGEMLIEAGIIDEVQLQAALGQQRRWGGKLGQALIDLRLATEPQIVAALSRKFGYEVANVSALERTPALEGALRLVPADVAVRQLLLPIAADTNTLTVAMGDPSNVASIDELSFRTGRRIKVLIAGEREIAAAARRLYLEESAGQDAAPVAPAPLEDRSSELALEAPIDPFASAPDPFARVRRPTSAPAPALAGGARSGVAAPLPPAHDLQPTLTPPPVLVPLGSEPRPLADDPFVKAAMEAGLEPPVPAERSEWVVPPPGGGALHDALERLARGEETALLGPGRLAAVLARLLLKRGLVDEAELLEELARK